MEMGKLHTHARAHTKSHSQPAILKGYNVRNVLSQLPAWGHDRGGGGDRGRSYFAGNGQNGDAALCIHLTSFFSPSMPFYLAVASVRFDLDNRDG